MSRTRTVLCVDDEKNVRSFLRRLFEREGYSVLEAVDAAEAFTLYQTHLPDLVIADIGMPEGGGCVLIARIREQAPDLPIIAITDMANMKDRVLAAGAHRVIRKPFRIDELMSAVVALVGK